jgi:phage terminase small subunit
MPHVKLTVKQEGFCQSYIETGNATEAYRLNYNTANMKPNTVEKKACELKKNGKVRGRLAELQKHHQERHNITVDSITNMYLNDREDARTAKQYATAVAATTGLAKLHGLVVEKKQIGGDPNNPLPVTINMNPVTTLQ